jgi:hypothetical protein
MIQLSDVSMGLYHMLFFVVQLAWFSEEAEKFFFQILTILADTVNLQFG